MFQAYPQTRRPEQPWLPTAPDRNRNGTPAPHPARMHDQHRIPARKPQTPIEPFHALHKFGQPKTHVMVVGFDHLAQARHGIAHHVRRQALRPVIDAPFLGGVPFLDAPVDGIPVGLDVGNADPHQFPQEAQAAVGHGELEFEPLGIGPPALSHGETRALAMRPDVVQQVAHQFADGRHELRVFGFREQAAHAAVDLPYRGIGLFLALQQDEGAVVLAGPSPFIRVGISLAQGPLDGDGLGIAKRPHRNGEIDHPQITGARTCRIGGPEAG